MPSPIIRHVAALPVAAVFLLAALPTAAASAGTSAPEDGPPAASAVPETPSPRTTHSWSASAAHRDGIPQFARRYGLRCAACHVSPPKLNEFGEAFVRNNYTLPELEERAESTIPLAIWASMRTDVPPAPEGMDRRVRTYLNRVEVISGGEIVVPWLTYFVEWRPLSIELRSDGSHRDRSGRFEDLFVTARRGGFEAVLGQFRQIAQVDVSRRLPVNEPSFFSTSLPGGGEGSAREVGLRSFSLSGRAPSARVGWIEEVAGGWEWTSYATVPLPGEISIPLTSEARREASNEVELAPKGLFLETFVRRGLTSYGLHAFLDSGERYQVGGVFTGRQGDLLWTGALGGARTGGSLLGRWSAEGEWIAEDWAAFGARGEGMAGRDPALVGFANLHFPGTSYTLRLTLEQRFQAGEAATLVELGAIF